MFERHGPPASRRLFVWFVVTTIVPALALGWLGWRMAAQDRALQGKVRQDSRDQAVELAATALQRTVAELEERLATASTTPSLAAGSFQDGPAVVVFGADGVRERAGTRLPYYPEIPATPAAPDLDLFARADALEFQQRNSAAAMRLLSGFAGTDKPPVVRAEALIRLARNARKLGQTAQALAAFDALIDVDSARVNGWPAGLSGHQGRALLLAAAGREADLAREAQGLSRELQSGHWLLTRAQYEFSATQAREWLAGQPSSTPDPEGVALAAVAEAVWREWQTTGRSDAAIGRRRTVRAGDRSVLVLTRGSVDRLVVMLAGPGFLDQAWRARIRAASGQPRLDFALSDAEGRAVLGQPSVPLSSQSVRTASVTQLPWTVHAISIGGGTGASALSGPAKLMLSAVLGMIVVVMAGGFFINRAIVREIKVARLQSDFVAAVSHEFRTPLTTLRHLSELLVRGRVSSDGRRQEFYETLLRESQRLHRLVEGLLNFARLESGQLEYRFETIDCADFLQEVVAEFQTEVAEQGYRVELQAGEGLPPVQADRELLARVIWNLLDNAVKYSADGRTVQVALTASADGVVIQVRDEGLGIPAAELTEIFRKFVRGSSSKSGAIKGTGIGLAMASEIVHAHGGTIAAASEPGHGSTFTVLLPMALRDQAQPALRTINNSSPEERQSTRAGG